MTPLGWIFMLASIGSVLSLVTFCYYRVLTKPSNEEREIGKE